jgi:hypothetical protein
MISLEQHIELLAHDYDGISAEELFQNLNIIGFRDKQKIKETVWLLASEGVVEFDSNWRIRTGDNIPAD